MRISLEWFEKGLYNLKDAAEYVVIIDALRASATIITAFENSVRTVIPVYSVEDGVMLKKKYKNALFSAEINGVKVDVADVGNSPTKLKKILKKNKHETLIIRTSAGSQMIRKAQELGFKKIIVGSFLNARAIAEYLLKENRDVGILCSGYNKKFFAIEDFLAAGCIISEMNNIANDGIELEDQALAAYLAFQASQNNLYEIVLQGRSAKRVLEIGEEEDIPESIKINSSFLVPLVVDDRIVAFRP